jgi:hypothetical protein
MMRVPDLCRSPRIFGTDHTSCQMNNRSLTGLNRYTTVEVSPCTGTEKLKRLQAGTS